MYIAVLLRLGAYGKHFLIAVAYPGDGGQTGTAAYAYRHHIVRNLEAADRQALMNPGHDGGPQHLVVGVVEIGIRQIRVIVIAAPDAAGIIRRIAGEPDILVAGGGAGFAGHRHIAQADLAVGGALRVFHHAPHGICEQIGGAGFHGGGGNGGGVVQHHVSVLIQHLGIKFRFDILAQIGDGSVGAAQLQVGNALGNAAQSQRLNNIRQHLRSGVIAFVKRGDPHILGIFIAQPGSNLRDAADSYHVDGADNSLPDGGGAGIIVQIPVADRGAVLVAVRLVVVGGEQGFPAGIQGRRVGGNDFEGGARLPFGVGGPV